MAVINTNPNFKRLRRSMMFLNAQKPSLIKDPYVYKPDSIMLTWKTPWLKTKRMPPAIPCSMP